MKFIKFTFFIKVLLGNLTNDYEVHDYVGSGRFESQTTSNIQESQIGRSLMPARKNNNSTYRLSPGGFILHLIARGVNNRSLKPRPPISIPPARGPRQTCNILDLSAYSLFEDSSPCRLICKRANSKCEACETRIARQQEICLSYYRKKMNVCKRCMKNPHKLTQAEIEKSQL